ncbi:malectin domain-containing carbohydrate-binding protein [uncultured Nocardioides sp.]|uniref:malectin domain-containing carbohydrate-binding protein n=1 Tax=uncultured Nocardioides sp. TaxID=198441 RepID=UPI0026047AFE|nr:malectin domain-containing carbohydrate-binding protein [uncultured Nocardioides sp.]
MRGHSRSHVGLVAGTAGALVAATAALIGPATPAVAGNTYQGNTVVSATPATNTPHAMNGSVNAITQIGNKIIAAGTFTSVSPASTFSNKADDVVRNRIFAFDATTGAIDPNFNPNLGGAANSLTTDGTYIYVGGSFSSVGGDTKIKRVVKLTAAGAVVSTFNAVPNLAVNEVVVRGSRLYLGGAFTSIKSGKVTSARAALAAVDSTTGAVLAGVDLPFAGVYDPATANGGGTTNVTRFDVTADGSRLAAIGNFATVAGQPRAQVVVIDTSGATATVAPWATNRFDDAHNDCAGVFDTFTRDIDFSPDGSYFVVSATGAFAGGVYSGTMCDSVSRWETASTGNDPTWMDYTGGDTTYGVAVTGGVVYVGGHMRWENNPFQGDQAGPGAVPREGIAALDPVNGLPLSWNPGRSRGVGAQALFATSAGLYVGSDTTKFAKQNRGRIAFLPLSSGTPIPTVSAATLPNDLFGAQRTTGAESNVLYRVDAAGPALQATDGGPDWSTSDGFVSGGNVAGWGATVARDATVPAGTPAEIFASERWAEQDWNFPVPAGRHVTVRLYFANQYDGTAQAGQRVFNVLLDGVNVLPSFDIVAAAGNKTGTMRSFSITTDGDGVDIDLRAITENPLINGIEIIDNDAVTGPSTSGVLQRRAVDATGAPTGAATTANSTIDWSTVRGGFLLNGTLYYGLNDGSLYKRTFTKATGALGAQKTVNLYDDPEDGTRIPFAIANMTGMFYDTATHRIYYTLFGDSQLYYRYFTPESEVVGAQTFVADANGVNFSTAAGVTLASGRLLYGSSADGSLRSVAFSGGRVTGTPSVVSSDGTWKYRALLVPNS